MIRASKITGAVQIDVRVRLAAVTTTVGRKSSATTTLIGATTALVVLR